MKRKVLMRILSCLIVGVMVLENPVQTFAAQDREVSVPVSGEEIQEETAVILGDEDYEDQSLSEELVEEAELTAEETDGSVIEEEEESDSEEPEVELTIDKPEVESSSEAAEEVREEAAEITESKDIQVESPVLNAEAEITWKIKTAQFGYTAKYTDSTAPQNYPEVVSVLQEAFESKNTTPVLPELEEERKLTADVLKDCITYVVANGSFDELLPEVSYTVSGEKVTSVTFSYIQEGMKLGLQKAESISTGVRLEFSVLNSVDWYEVYRKSAMESEAAIEKVAGFNPVGSAGVFLDTSATDIEDYTYIIYGYDQQNGDMITYSNVMTSTYMFAEPKITIEPSNRNGVRLTWTAVQGADSYTISRKRESEGTFTVLTTVSGATSYTDITAQSGEYVYCISAKGYVGEELRTSAEATATIKWDSSLAAPTVTASSTAGDRIKISWEPVEGADAYAVYEYVDGQYKKIRTQSAAYYTATGLRVGNIYRYAVQAYRNEGSTKVYGVLSGVRSARTTMSAVKLSTNPLSYNTIRLVWGASAQADSYEIWRRQGSGSFRRIATVSAGGVRAYNDTNVLVGQTYSYKIRPAKTVDGVTYRGNYSSVVSAKTKLNGGNITSVKGNNYKSLKISWSKIAGADGYELYRSKSASSGFSMVTRVTSGSVLTYIDNGLTLGTTYYYRVRPYRVVSGARVYGAYSSVIKGKVQLAAPTGIKATGVDYSRIKITWNGVEGADGYQVLYSLSKDTGYKVLKTTGSREVVLENVVCGKTYYFKVRAYKNSGTVLNGMESAVVSRSTALNKVTGLSVSERSYNSIMIKWNAVPGAKKYQIYGSASSNSGFKLLATTTSANYKQEGLTLGKTYYYKVRAFRDQYATAFTSVYSAKTALGTLKGLKAEKISYDDAVKVSWDKVDGVTKYVVLRSTSQSGTYSEVAEVSSNSFVDLNVSSSKTYYYKVYGIRGTYKTNTAGPVSSRMKVVSYGIDVSSYQGDIDWEKVADDDIDFAMLRAVVGKGSGMERDSRFKEYYDGAREEGIKVGAYRYTYATTRTKARAEAEAVIKALNGRKLDYPVVLDVEDDDTILSSTIDKTYRSEIILAFKEEVEDAGYKFALYASSSCLENKLDMDKLKDVDIWIARWRSLELGHGYTGKGNVTMWQYSSSGSVDGIKGKVDLDVSYKDY